MGWIIGLTCFAAWLNHVFTCFSEGLWGYKKDGTPKKRSGRPPYNIPEAKNEQSLPV
jgi:hypothetical protein